MIKRTNMTFLGKSISATAVALFALSLAPDVLAQNGGRPGGNPNERQELLERFDTDGDGTLSDQERGALRQFMQERADRGDRGARGDRGDRGNMWNRGGGGGSGWGGGPGGTGRYMAALSRITDQMFQPVFLLRDVGIYSRELQLDDTQQMIVEAVLRDYTEQFETDAAVARSEIEAARPDLENDEEMQQQRGEMEDRMREMRDSIRAEIEEMRESGELGEDRNAIREVMRERFGSIREEMESAMQEVFSSDRFTEMYGRIAEISQAWLNSHEELIESTQGNLIAVLEPAQTPSLESVQRELRRERAMANGELAGERVDLIKSIKAAGLEPDGGGATQPLLAQYVIDLDEAIQTRDKELLDAVPSLAMALKRSAGDSAHRVIKQTVRARQSVRDVNDEYLESIGETLAGQQALAFRIDALAAGYPRVYRETGTSRIFEAALRLEGLDDETFAKIEAMFADYEAALGAINDQILAETRRSEPDELIDRQSRAIAFLTGGSVDRDESSREKMQELDERKRETGREYADMLEGLLTAEQWESLPRARGNRDRDGGRGFDGGDREAFMSRFDTNGDGEISDEERDQIREHFRGGGGQGRNRGDRGGGPPVDF